MAGAIHIALTNEQKTLPVDRRRLRRAVQWVLQDAGVSTAEISLAVVDDPTIHRLNRQYLNHDYATDVLSFTLEREPGRLVGEVIVSADTAQAAAPTYGWPAEDELLLYVIHGTLHLVGQEDGSRAERAEMRRREALYLARFGLKPHARPAPSRRRRQVSSRQDLRSALTAPQSPEEDRLGRRLPQSARRVTRRNKPPFGKGKP